MAAWRDSGGGALLARAGFTTELLWATLALVAVILVGAAVLMWLDRWRKRRSDDDLLTPGDELSHFEALHREGKLSTEEFEKVRSLLNRRLRQALDGKPPAPPEGAVREGPPPTRDGEPPAAPPAGPAV